MIGYIYSNEAVLVLSHLARVGSLALARWFCLARFTSLFYIARVQIFDTKMSDFNDDDVFAAFCRRSRRTIENAILQHAARLHFRQTKVYVIFHHTDTGEYTTYNSHPSSESFPPSLQQLVSLGIFFLSK